MNFIKSILIGMGVYIGWHLIDAINHGFNYRIEKHISKTIRMRMPKKEDTKTKKKVVMGFRPD